MTLKFGSGENDRNIHMSRTLRASRVIGWYSDIKKLSFAFIPRRTEGHLFGINGPLANILLHRCYYYILSGEGSHTSLAPSFYLLFQGNK